MALWIILQNILGAAGGTALVLLLAKYLGDRSLQRVTQRHGKEQAEMQNTFSIGVTSHMATVVFDKHIGFCEEYVQAVSNALYALMQEGTKGKPLDHKEFFRIRQKWVLWLSHEMEVRLDRFERGVADAQGVDANGAPVSNEVHVRTLIADLREVLGAEDFTKLRSELVVRSLRTSP